MLVFLRLLIVVCFHSRAALAAENLALRHQLGVLARTARAWGTPGGDIDGDGDTGITDLLALLAAWGACD
jgi:hypothetical protein